ncbi:glycosyltransferase [Methylomonas sp. HYX-M1]|uniref:glycosyltransferase family protein n=1 Tax=Methylomonas sp. HYX-M1 TaxID=3139307 RepID=UPI00345B6401
MAETVLDCFYLNIEDAYRAAEAGHTVAGADGRRRQAYCYYDGPLTDITLPNFIQVSAERFVEFFSHNQLPIPGKIAISQDGKLHFDDMPADIVEEIRQYRATYTPAESIHFDTYFVDPLLALNVAKQRNRVTCGHPTIDGLQVCYYRGELPEHALENLLHLELDEFEDFFVRSRLRMPEDIQIPDGLEQDVQTAVRQDIAHAVESVKRRRIALIQQLLNKAKALRPGPNSGRPRMFVPSSRLTTVMQYSSRGIAKAFAAMGWETLVYIEANDMEGSNTVDMLRSYIDFAPHACFYVNSLNNSFLHDEVVNLVWWQDLMPQLKNRQPLNWRDRDFNFSITPQFDRYLTDCAAKQVERLHFVIDDAVFHNSGGGERAERVVFIGSSYRPFVNFADTRHRQALDGLTAVMESGGTFDQATVAAIAAAAGLDYEFVFWKLLHYATRDHSLHWLCQARSELPIDVYGRYWEQDDLIAPYFRGELVHGEAVAEVYRRARYALVCHPFEVNSQRLAEVAACGCIPLVYDCRDVAEAPYWERHCLFFKTAADLQNILSRRLRPAEPPELLAAQFTYKAAARRVGEVAGLASWANPAARIEAMGDALLPDSFGARLRLQCDSAATRRACLGRWQANLAALAQHRPQLHAQLMQAWQTLHAEIELGSPIGDEFWRISVSLSGRAAYRLDIVALLEHRAMLADNAKTMTRENTCCYALAGIGAGYELLAAFQASERPIPEMAEFEVPLYVFESRPDMWLLNLLLHDLVPLLAAPRLRIYHGERLAERIEAEFARFEAALPDVLFNLDPGAEFGAEAIFQRVIDAKQNRAQRHADNLRDVAEYYAGIGMDAWRDKFREERRGELRVMGFISRFSSYLKYCMRDWLDGFERLGANVQLCSESENYYLSTIEQLLDDINRFKPDLILTIDHFRHEYQGIPQQLPFVNWIQDMLPNIRFNQIAPGPFDLNFVFAQRWLSFNTLPLYQDYPLQFLPLGFNDSQYHPLPQTVSECDVLLVSHLEAPGDTLQPLRDPALQLNLNAEEADLIRRGVLSLTQLRALYAVLESHCAPMTMAEFEEFCTVHPGKTAADFRDLFARHGYTLSDEVLDLLLCLKGNRLHCEYLNRMKYWPIRLLAGAFPNLKIQVYGKHWEAYPAFAGLARGVAENGAALNRIMQQAKICLNANPGVTLHMRALEIIAAGRFMLSRQMLYDGSPLREFFDADAVVLYRDEADLLAKVEYYLNNPQARERVAANALRGLDQKLSYRAVAERILAAAVQRFCALEPA